MTLEFFMRPYSTNKNHPELLSNEHFFVNTKKADLPALLKEHPEMSLRVGKIAYMTDGRTLAVCGFPDYVPVFRKERSDDL